VIRTLRCLASWSIYMGYWGTRVVLASLVGVRYRRGGIYDRAGREWGRTGRWGCVWGARRRRWLRCWGF